jgi:hypothetical protein
LACKVNSIGFFSFHLHFYRFFSFFFLFLYAAPEGKRLSLKELRATCPEIQPELLTEDLVSPAVREIQATTAADFRFPDVFSMSSNVTFSEIDKRWGVAEAYKDLIATPGANPNMISPEWVKNHFRWIVWKLAATERSFPEKFGQQLCQPDNVLNQLRYRYEREINLAQRSALKKITEKDDVSTRELVLCVWDIVLNHSPPQTSSADACLLRLTDGWYSLDARVDSYLLSLVQSSKIFVGQKLKIFGAEVRSCLFLISLSTQRVYFFSLSWWASLIPVLPLKFLPVCS